MSRGARFVVSVAIILAGVGLVIATRGSDAFMLASAALLVSAIAVGVAG